MSRAKISKKSRKAVNYVALYGVEGARMLEETPAWRLDRGADVEDELTRAFRTLELYAECMRSMTKEMDAWRTRYNMALAQMREGMLLLPQEDVALRTSMAKLFEVVGGPFWDNTRRIGESETRYRTMRRIQVASERLHRLNIHALKKNQSKLAADMRKVTAEKVELREQLRRMDKRETDNVRETRARLEEQKSDAERACAAEWARCSALESDAVESKLSLAEMEIRVRQDAEEIAALNAKVQALQDDLAQLRDMFGAHEHPVSVLDLPSSSGGTPHLRMEMAAWVNMRAEKRKRARMEDVAGEFLEDDGLDDSSLQTPMSSSQAPMPPSQAPMSPSQAPISSSQAQGESTQEISDIVVHGDYYAEEPAARAVTRILLRPALPMHSGTGMSYAARLAGFSNAV